MATAALIGGVLGFALKTTSEVFDVFDKVDERFGDEARFRDNLNDLCRDYSEDMKIQDYGPDDGLKDRASKRLGVHSDFLSELESDLSPPNALYRAFNNYRGSVGTLHVWALDQEKRIPDGVPVTEASLNRYMKPSRKALAVADAGSQAATEMMTDVCAAHELLWPL